MIADDWLSFLKRTRAYHVNIVGLLSEGLMTTVELRRDGLVDTSSESLAHHRQRLTEVEDMLVKTRCQGAGSHTPA